MLFNRNKNHMLSPHTNTTSIVTPVDADDYVEEEKKKKTKKRTKRSEEDHPKQKRKCEKEGDDDDDDDGRTDAEKVIEMFVNVMKNEEGQKELRSVIEKKLTEEPILMDVLSCAASCMFSAVFPGASSPSTTTTLSPVIGSCEVSPVVDRDGAVLPPIDIDGMATVFAQQQQTLDDFGRNDDPLW